MKFSVWFSDNSKKFNPNYLVYYHLAGEIEAEDEHDCFRKTQNGISEIFPDMPDSWNEKNPCRSSMVGDIFMQENGTGHFVKADGFATITLAQLNAGVFIHHNVETMIWEN